MAEGFQQSTLNCEKKGKMVHPWDVENEESLTCAGPGRSEWRGGGHFFFLGLYQESLSSNQATVQGFLCLSTSSSVVVKGPEAGSRERSVRIYIP